MFCLNKSIKFLNFIKSQKFNDSFVKKNNFLHKFNYNFSSFNFIQNNLIKLYFRHKSKYFYEFGVFNNILYLKFFKNLNLLLKENNNFIIFDSEIEYILPVYNYIYGNRSVESEKTFFFLNNKFLTYSNTLYFYKLFLKRHKINFVVILNYNFVKTFILMFSKLNLPLFGILHDSQKWIYLDFYFYCSKNYLKIIKIITLNRIVSTFFYYYNFKLFLAKKKYFFEICKIEI